MHDAGSARRLTLSICPFATTLYNVHRRIHPNCVLLRDGANVSLAAGVGETLFGVIVDTECDATGQLLTPLSGLPSPSRCKPASFRAAFVGPAMLVAPVWPVIGTAHYDFSAHLATLSPSEPQRTRVRGAGMISRWRFSCLFQISIMRTWIWTMRTGPGVGGTGSAAFSWATAGLC